MTKILVVGAGLSGAAVARVLGEEGFEVKVIDERNHVGGNCHTYLDPDTGIMIHAHGAHIFHTDFERVWAFINRFASFKPYTHKVKTISGGHVYSLPINLLTINQLFGKALSPAEAKDLIASLADGSLSKPANFEEQAQAFLGEKLYRAFFYGYTWKQWGREPRELPASVLNRLPVRFNYNDNYFTNKYQGIPIEGYTDLVEKMLNFDQITVSLKTPYEHSFKGDFSHVFYSGPLDRYFNYKYGRLPYRTVEFEWFTEKGDYQGCSVMNYADSNIPWTRVIEHKHFAYWQDFEATVCCREIPRESRQGDILYYPVRFATQNDLLEQYQKAAMSEERLTFIGRLGTFKYLDMDTALAEALNAADHFLASRNYRARVL